MSFLVYDPTYEAAACIGLDTEIFFLPDQVRGAEKLAREAIALDVCHSCPIVDTCLQDALDGNEDYGVFGGTRPEERRRMKRPRIEEGDGDPRHGTQNGYNNLGCRCGPCRAGNSAAIRTQQAAQGGDTA